MITGAVSPQWEAILRLKLYGPRGEQADVDVLLDTGFNGFLTLPATLISTLGLPWLGQREAVLADNSKIVVDLYQVTVQWNGQPRAVRALATGGNPLLGMSFLHGHRIRADVVEGGPVTVEPLPSKLEA